MSDTEDIKPMGLHGIKHENPLSGLQPDSLEGQQLGVVYVASSRGAKRPFLRFSVHFALVAFKSTA